MVVIGANSVVLDGHLDANPECSKRSAGGVKGGARVEHLRPGHSGAEHVGSVRLSVARCNKA